MGKKKPKEIELQQTNIILKIPENTVSLEVRASLVNDDGKLFTVKRKLSVQDIFQARQDFLDNVELGDDYDARFALTEEGKEHFDGIYPEDR